MFGQLYRTAHMTVLQHVGPLSHIAYGIHMLRSGARGELPVRLFLHVITDDQPIFDPEGEEFTTIASAVAAAQDSARELMIDALRSRRTLPLTWRIRVADEAGNVAAEVSLASVALGFEISRTPIEQRALVSEVDAR